jgi:hypothetical protein
LKLVYDFTEEEFISYCIGKVQRNGTTIFEDIYDAISYYLSYPVDTCRVITQIKHHYKTEYYDSHLSLSEYIENGFIEFYYPSMELYSKKEKPLTIEEVCLPKFISQQSIKYGGGVKKKIKVKNHILKTKNKVSVELLHLKINKQLLSKIIGIVDVENVDLLPSKLGVWEWRQTFYNKITGKSYFCTCFGSSIKKEGFEIDGNVHVHIQKAVKDNSFKENICHICKNTNSDLFFCHPMYASSFKVKYGAYIKKVEIEKEIDEREAENIIREIKGVAKIGERWINETLLFNYIDILFPNFKVKREASPPWLGNQRLDIFIPELNLAIEYQGEQHFKAVDIFGGKEGLKKNKERDKDKLSKCKKNKIKLIYFTYKDNLSEKIVCSRLKKYLKQVN